MFCRAALHRPGPCGPEATVASAQGGAELSRTGSARLPPNQKRRTSAATTR
jgi:hypothetical protein